MISSEMAGEGGVKNVCSAPAGVMQICHEPLEASPWEVSSVMRQKLVFIPTSKKGSFLALSSDNKHAQDAGVVM